MPLTIADGVYYNARVVMNKHTAVLLKDLMVKRGLDISDKEANLAGAIRSEIDDEIEADAQNPSEVQRRLVEQQKQRDEALKKINAERAK